MAATTPPGWHTITPRLFAPNPEGLVAFLRDVFAATGVYNVDRPSEVQIGDSWLLVSGTDVRPPTPACFYVYVENVDATYARALQLGALSLEEPGDQPYGDRRAMVEDGWGNLWQIATRK
jgi:uncharacterized glyoxalase superfamily protein PhnB